MASRDNNQRSSIPSNRFLDYLNYRYRTSPIHSPYVQRMEVDELTAHLAPRNFNEAMITDTELGRVGENILLSNALWELERQKVAVNHVLDVITKEIDLIKDTQKHLNSRVQRLPPEILLYIFSYAVYTIDDSPGPFFSSTLCQVSRRWRNLAMTTPSLWRRVTFQLPRSRTSGHRHAFAAARAHLVRSKEQLIDAELAFQGETLRAEDATAALSVLSLYFGRCKRLEVLYETTEPMYATLAALTRFPPGPALETLCLKVGYRRQERLEYRAPTRPSEPYVFFAGQAPRLKYVELDGIAVPWRGPMAALRRLEELHLAKQPKEDRPSLREFVDILKASPSLQRLSILRSGPRWEDTPYDQVKLLRLQRLTLSGVPPDIVSCMLSVMATPVLDSLTLSFLDSRLRARMNASAVLHRFSSSQTFLLRSLSLENAEFDTDSLLSFLSERGTELEELRLVSTNAEDELLENMTATTDASSWICPDLTSFTLEECDNVDDRALRFFRSMRGGTLDLGKRGDCRYTERPGVRRWQWV